MPDGHDLGPDRRVAAAPQGFPGISTLHRPVSHPLVLPWRGEMGELIESKVSLAEAPLVPRTPTPLSAPILFALVAFLCAISFSVPVALLARNAMTSEPTFAFGTAETTAAPGRTPAPQAVTVRVLSATGSAEALGSGHYQVTFTWMLEGARAGDAATIRFFMGSTQMAEERGNLDSSVFEASTGQLRLTTSQDCSAQGWSAEIVLLRNTVPQGERTARAAGVSCD